jgi:hypothetical protein
VIETLSLAAWWPLKGADGYYVLTLHAGHHLRHMVHLVFVLKVLAVKRWGTIVFRLRGVSSDSTIGQQMQHTFLMVSHFIEMHLAI